MTRPAPRSAVVDVGAGIELADATAVEHEAVRVSHGSVWRPRLAGTEADLATGGTADPRRAGGNAEALAAMLSRDPAPSWST